jgi:putative transposase
MDWKQSLAYITGSVDQELLLRNEYLVTENRILRKQLQGRVRRSDGERKTLAEIGKMLGKRALEEIAPLVTPNTILAWHRTLIAQKFEAPSSARLLGDQRSARRWRRWWCAWPERIARRAMIASLERSRIWAIV